MFLEAALVQTVPTVQLMYFTVSSQSTVFKDFTCDLLTGRLPETQKDQVMEKFRSANKTQILVSTTVIEVGVDVPNATVMIVFNADRFGLATCTSSEACWI